MSKKIKSTNLKKFPANAKKKTAYKEYAVCKKCNCAYYDKAWHSSLADFKHLKNEGKQIKFQICPACRLIIDKQYNGLITIKNLSKEYDKELKNLIKNFGEHAMSVDPLDRVISAKRKKLDFEILTTENQSAVRLSKKIKSSFAHLKLKMTVEHSPSERVSRIKLKSAS